MLRRKFILIGTLLTVMLFSGCLPSPKPYTPAKIEEGKALIYVYRLESIWQRGVGWTIKMNGKTKRKYFLNNSYVPIYVEPGDITVEITEYVYPYGVYDKIVLHDVKAGNVYYIKAIPGPFSVTNLKVVDADIGEKELKETEYYEDIKE